jgi:hypothetical protein
MVLENHTDALASLHIKALLSLDDPDPETEAKLTYKHSWASAFRQPVSQSGTGAFRNRTRSPYSGPELVPASAFFFFPVPD